MSGRITNLRLVLGLAAGFLPAFAGVAASRSDIEVIVAVGAAGEEQYAQRFAGAEALWRERCEEAGAAYTAVGLGENEGGAPDLERLGAEIERRLGSPAGELWVVLIGHGTFDGRVANFNLRGPDLSATQLRDWLEPRKSGLVVINTASCSSPFLQSLSGPGRIVVTATKSPNEIFFPEFGEHFAMALAAPDADLDEDGQTSLLESFLRAGRLTAADYEERGLLATEHALIDDNGDGAGTRADWFQGVKVFKRSEGEAEPDGMRAHQRHLLPSEAERRIPAELRRQRDEIELEVNALRYRKGEMAAEDYYGRLEGLLLRIAEIYREAGDSADSPGKGPGS